MENKNVQFQNISKTMVQVPTLNSQGSIVNFANSDTDSDNDNYQGSTGLTTVESNMPIEGETAIKPKVIQVQNEDGVQLIFGNSASNTISGQPMVVSVGGNYGNQDNQLQVDNAGPQYDDSAWTGACCVICGDRGSGYHYSVLSCEGCKGFFKRTVQKNLLYQCKDTRNGPAGQCTVIKMTRNNCQYCRYQKCLQYGMKREAVREDRSPGGKHRTKRPRIGGEGDDDAQMNLEREHQIAAEHNEMISKLLQASPDKVPPNDSKTLESITIDELMSFGYLELNFIIEWAKKVPGFRDFDMSDQMALLKSAFMELNVFRLTYRSLEFDEQLRFAEGLVVPRTLCEKLGWGLELVNATLEFVTRMRDLNLDNVEFAIMNAIVLTYPDAIGIVDKAKVTQVQTKFLDVLRRYVCLKHSSDKGRFGKLLLRLPTLRTLSAKAAERFLSLTLEGVLPLNDLVHEMMC